jgi:hypothetical protein
LSVTIRWMWVMPWAANQTRARVHETDCSNGFFVLKRFGVGEA